MRILTGLLTILSAFCVPAPAGRLEFGLTDTVEVPEGATVRYYFGVWNYARHSPGNPVPEAISFQVLGFGGGEDVIVQAALAALDGSMTVPGGSFAATTSTAVFGASAVSLFVISGRIAGIPEELWETTDRNRDAAVLELHNLGAAFTLWTPYRGIRTVSVSLEGHDGRNLVRMGAMPSLERPPLELEDGAAVPEPGGLLLAAIGLLALGTLQNRRSCFFKVPKLPILATAKATRNWFSLRVPKLNRRY